MSRAIKFRAWDGRSIRYDVTGFEHGRDNEMVCVFLNGDCYAIGDRSSQHPNAEVMQFTGLTDRNGVEIYESDVVRWLVNTDHSVDAPVGFESGAFYMLDAINQGYGKVYNDWLRGDYTVLGNIYEHPELLEAKP